MTVTMQYMFRIRQQEINLISSLLLIMNRKYNRMKTDRGTCQLICSNMKFKPILIVMK